MGAASGRSFAGTRCSEHSPGTSLPPSVSFSFFRFSRRPSCPGHPAVSNVAHQLRAARPRRRRRPACPDPPPPSRPRAGLGGGQTGQPPRAPNLIGPHPRYSNSRYIRLLVGPVRKHLAQCCVCGLQVLASGRPQEQRSKHPAVRRSREAIRDLSYRSPN